MITILSPDEQLKYLPIRREISEELRRREQDKLRMVNKVPFLRVSCLQKVTYTDGDSNLSEVKNRVGTSDISNTVMSTVDGFIFELNSSFDESYGERQVIGTELSSLKKLYVKNPRRVPPPRLESFTATIGEEAGFYTTGTLKFTVNSKEQLEFLTPFLLHPGNTLIFEFGYSDRETTMNENLFTNSDINDFLSDIIVKKGEQVTRRQGQDSSFFERLQQKIVDTNGNYEYLVGVVNNFDFSLNDNFGFDVSIDVWSISKTIVSSKDSGNFSKESNPRAASLSETSTIIRNREQDVISYVSEVEEGFIRKVVQDLPQTQTVNAVEQYNGTSAITTVPITFTTLPGQERTTLEKTKEDRNSVITIDTSRGFSKYIRIQRIIDFLQLKSTEISYKSTLVRTNPYIISHDNSCIIFRKNQPTLSNVKVNTDTLYIDFNRNDIDFRPINQNVIPISTIRLETTQKIVERELQTTIPQSFQGRGGAAGGAFATGRLAVREDRGDVTTNLPYSFKPYIFDSLTEDGFGDIGNIYYDAQLFVEHYKNFGGKPIDVLKKILNDVNYATRNVFDLKLLETFNLKDPSAKSNNTILSFSGRTIEPQDRDNTYTFKFNQQESIVTSLTFELGLEGLVADQIYFESINQPNNDIESTKLNLLLFEKHENNIILEDKRNIRIQKEYERQKEQGGNSTLSDTKSQATGSFFELYQSDPSDYLLSFTTPNTDNTKSQLKQKLQDITDESSINKVELLSTISGSIVPLIDRNSEPYFQAMKEIGYIESKSDINQPDSDGKTLGGISPLLESRLTMSLPGVGGLQPLQFFNTEGLPDVYDKRGDFCIMSVTQTISPDDWTTSLSAAFRVRRKDE